MIISTFVLHTAHLFDVKKRIDELLYGSESTDRCNAYIIFATSQALYHSTATVFRKYRTKRYTVTRTADVLSTSYIST